ncbi:lipocalin-like domain-containing protein [Clostridium tyrobutyricum]|uniref:lipocalin-like domain-containing protein n=1 Tax=Clostridium tyrobutyricum TaxID=1519 RepID=UPI001C39479F|nr:lipocalin-like domain-containing protein [Clostridium tyrobutyricum]MBV4429655.1 hypothetical protein [Clostridium tyrobutyricum]MBV4444886.1 hypothetical protein [Clostridium tyrobutyricum]
MTRARLMKSQEDYQRIGVKKGIIQPWEDGKRENYRAGVFEWWYFDAILDDGSTVAACYSTKVQPFTFLPGLHPALTFHITEPDGTTYSERFTKFKKKEVVVKEGKCNVHYGPHCIEGDMQNYHIKAEPINGTGYDLYLKKDGISWRGDTGYIGFGEKDEKYFTWTCFVPRGKVTGTITVGGKTRKITGMGYHDHQWGTIMQFDFLNNWLWSRQNGTNYSIVVFDFIMNQKYDYKRIPLVFIQDKEGNLIFEETEHVKCEVLEEFTQEVSGAKFPKVTRYYFENHGKKVTYTLTVLKELEGRDIYKQAPAILRRSFDKKGSHPKYGRYLAQGELIIEENGQEVYEVGELIYEFPHLYQEYKKYMEQEV